MKKKRVSFALICITLSLRTSTYCSEDKKPPSLVSLCSDIVSQKYTLKKKCFEDLKKKGVPLPVALLVAEKVNSLIGKESDYCCLKKSTLMLKKGKLESLYGLNNVISLDDRQNTKNVNFRHKHVSFIPSLCLRSFNQLQSLDLSYNKIEKLPYLLFKECSGLQSINLSHNSIKYLDPQLLIGLMELESLNFSHNSIQGIPKDFLKDLLKLKSFSFSHNKIKELTSQSIYNLPTLKYIYFAANKLVLLQRESIAKVPQLKSIDLHGNNIKKLSIPEELKIFVKL